MRLFPFTVYVFKKAVMMQVPENDRHPNSLFIYLPCKTTCDLTG